MLILRVDVDNPYNYYKSWGKLLNYFSLNFFNLRSNVLGYLHHFYELHDYLVERGAKATFFIRTETIPLRRINLNYFEVALHAVDTSSFKAFKDEVDYLSKYYRIYGFSKHGFGRVKLSRRHYAPYEPDKYIKWGMKLGLKYFSGNDIGIKNVMRINKEFYYFPSILLLESKDFNTNEVIQLSENYHVVVCFHPVHWFNLREVREKLDRIIDKHDTFRFIDLIGSL